jgi:hypothetical protein
MTRSGSNGRAQLGAKLSVTLDIPLAAHGFAAAFAPFGIEQNPFPPARRLGADPRIVLPQASLEVRRPADIGSAIILPSASQHVNEKEFLMLGGPFSHGSMSLKAGGPGYSRSVHGVKPPTYTADKMR